MAEAPRRIGRPLDITSAISRANQIAVIADPFRLRVLSAVATVTDSPGEIREVALALSNPVDEVAAALNALEDAGLVTSSAGDGYHLTAEAWIRFGRLIASVGGSSHSSAKPAVPHDFDMPPVAARIADTLAYRFSSYFSPETVAKYVAESYALLSERAHIVRFLPSLTTRFATERLSALAAAEGLVLRGTPEVLFVCVQNAGRSQMAAGILRYLVGNRVHVRTAGSAPAPSVHPTVIEALDEIGIPLASEFPKPLTDEVVQAADYVITMGCGDACPIYPGRRYMDWAIDDPVGLPIEEVRRVRDDIYERVESLVEGMNLR